MEVTVEAPLAGTLVPLSAVPDPVFAQEIVGPGVAIEPELRDSTVTVVAPVAGRVASLFPHAFALQTEEGLTVLVHLGIDTVRLDGQGFNVQVSTGDTVAVGAPMIEWDVSVTRDEGLATVCPVIALQGDPTHVRAAVPLGTRVQAGAPIIDWAIPVTRSIGESQPR